MKFRKVGLVIGCYSAVLSVSASTALASSSSKAGDMWISADKADVVLAGYNYNNTNHNHNNYNSGGHNNNNHNYNNNHQNYAYNNSSGTQKILSSMMS